MRRRLPAARLALMIVIVAVGAPSPSLRGSTVGLITVVASTGGQILGVGQAWGAPAAPGFRVTFFDSPGTLDFRELIGKKVLVVRFQASYCRPCVRESGAFNRLVERYRDRDVEFVAFHVQDTVRDVRRFMRAQKVAYPVALDPKLVVGNQFGFKGTPYTVVVDLKGEMVAQISGASAVTRLPKILDDALKTTPGT